MSTARSQAGRARAGFRGAPLIGACLSLACLTLAGGAGCSSTATSSGGTGGSARGSGGAGPGSDGSGPGGSNGGVGSGGSAVAATGGSSGPGTGGGIAGSVGSGGSGIGGGAGGGAPLHGGSSARFICPGGVTYAPATWGSVSQIGAPNTPPANYFAFIEGPVWIESLGTLFFSDNASSPAERIFKLVPPSLVPMSFMESSGSNGLAVDNDDQLIVADQRNRRLVRVNPTTGLLSGVVVPPGPFTPNDVVVRGDGNIYFTDPATGFYRVSPTGTVGTALKQVSRPNGVALAPDENTLYVGDVGNRQIRQFALLPDGTVNAGSDQLFATARNDTVDGLCVDCAGNVYASTAQGVEVYGFAGGFLGTIPTGEASNCTFGGADRRTMYVTARALLKAIPVTIPGLPD